WLRHVRPGAYLSPFYLYPEGARCPSVLTVHDVAALRLKEELPLLPRTLFRLSLFRAARARIIVTVSEFSRSEIISRLRLAADRVRAVLNGMPRARGELEARRPAGMGEKAFALVVGD